MNKLAVAAVLSFGSVCFAEAGVPFSFCAQAACVCGTATCTCGQVCNANTSSCGSAQTGFCTTDAECAGSCDHFICELNVCVRGTRDGGTDPRPDGGTGGGGGGNGGGGEGGGPGEPQLPRGCGCDAGAALPLALFSALLVRRSNRRCR